MRKDRKPFMGHDVLEPFGSGMVNYSSLHAHIHGGSVYNAMVKNAAVAAGLLFICN